MKEETELVLGQANNVKMINDVFKNPVVETLISTISIIPAVELATNTIKTIISDMQIKKQREFLECIIIDNSVTMDDIRSNEVIFEFYKTLDAVNRLAGREKIKYLANLFSAFAKDEEKNIDEYEEMLVSFSDLSFREIEILYYLYVTEDSIASDNLEKNINDIVEIIWDTFVKKYKSKYPKVIFETVMLKATRNGYCMCEWLTYCGASKMVAYTTMKFDELVKRAKLNFE